MKLFWLGTTALAAVVAAGAAQAADMPVKAPVYAAPFNWTGFYIGAHIGAGWSTKEWSNPLRGRQGRQAVTTSTASWAAVRSATTGSRVGPCSGSRPTPA